MKAMTADHQTKLLDFLNGRLAFEGTGVKLYDRILEQVRQSVLGEDYSRPTAILPEATS